MFVEVQCLGSDFHSLGETDKGGVSGVKTGEWLWVCAVVFGMLFSLMKSHLFVYSLRCWPTQVAPSSICHGPRTVQVLGVSWWPAAMVPALVKLFVLSSLFLGVSTALLSAGCLPLRIYYLGVLNYLQTLFTRASKSLKTDSVPKPWGQSSFQRDFPFLLSLIFVPSLPWIQNRSLAKIIPRGMFELKLESFLNTLSLLTGI